MNVTINWGIFKVKFNGKENKAFESLAYYLFCNEHGNKTGIFRFKNQRGIETDPIKVGRDIIGFQAKYYETQISRNKKDVIDSIKKAKKNNSKLTKIFFYLNQEFSEGTGKKDPQYKKVVENEAHKLGVDIEWRVPSHIERQLVLPENCYLADHFFSLDESKITFLHDLQLHGESILIPIRSEIKFAGKIIKINRDVCIHRLLETSNTTQIIILTGEAGIGKTAVIKDFFGKFYNTKPIYLFKAAEFNLNNNINEYFKQYGNFTLIDFIDAHKEEKQKYIIIDSAEKLSDLNNQDPFLEFLSIIIKDGWKVIFATRYSYLDSLQFQFVEIYRIPFKVINIEGISEKQLIKLSEKYDFDLPSEKRLLDLIKIPFYLDEYLENYKNLNKNISYYDFRESLWKKKIQHSSRRTNNIHITRESCFLTIVKQKVDSGKFYISVSSTDCSNDAIQGLLSDEIIQYDEKYGGYFITHDVYEEWALEKLIDIEFNKCLDNNKFFKNIGNSYPIRRAFRNWLSEKLFMNAQEFKVFIEQIIKDDSIENHWKDETLVSILLSDYSKGFFAIFEKELLANSSALFKRIIFLIRIACKEVDDEFYKSLGLNSIGGWNAKYVFTKPMGDGWKTLIDFINHHIDKIGLANINIILPLLYDWNNKNKIGETTRRASLIALYYYKRLQEEDILWKNDENKNKLIQVIVYGALEIKEELISIFQEVIKNKWNNHRDPYYDMNMVILTMLDGIWVWRVLPNYVLKIADLFWCGQSDKIQLSYMSGGFGVEKYYCLNENIHMVYLPASAYQTPIFWLLQIAPKETIDFILNLINKCVECYAKSEFGKFVKKASFIIDNKTIVKQYISDNLWCMYRGTGSPVTPDLLQSIHMALEKYFLEQTKNVNSKTLESQLLYLLTKSKSASIAAVVASIVLAYPDKTFNIAKILFQTKEFFLCDKHRLLEDQSVTRTLYSIGYGLNYQHKIYQDERITTCDDKYRTSDLEHLMRSYQFVKSRTVSSRTAEKRQEVIWEILDNYYAKTKGVNEDKTWQLYLARMDRRKMKPQVQIKDNNILIDFNPQITPNLKKYSEESINKSNELMKYISLKLWAIYKFDNDERYKEYKKYEDNVQLALQEVKEIVGELNNKSNPDFILFNHTIPAYACAILIRDYLGCQSQKDKEFCKRVILEYSSLPLRDGYQYQIHDGVEAAINTLPLLLKIFPSEKEKIKTTLLLTLFDSYPIGNYKRLLDYSVEALLKDLWDISSVDALSIFLGYLLLKPKHIKLMEKLYQENCKKHIFQISQEEVIKNFLEKNKTDLEKVINNKLEFNYIKNIEQLDLEILGVAFELIPTITKNEVCKSFINIVLPIFAKKALKDSRDVDYALKHRIFKKFAYFILSREKAEIKGYIQPFIEHFTCSSDMADLLSEIISAEDTLKRYDQFWLIWESFYNKVLELCNSMQKIHYSKMIIYNYLLAWPYWKETAKEWHTLKEREKLFFKRVAEEMGHCPAVFYSISKLLNEIGSGFLDDGVSWISNMLKKNEVLWNVELETNTIYYLEIIIRKYYISNREIIRKNAKSKGNIIGILNFLVEKGSAVGFLLREEIL